MGGSKKKRIGEETDQRSKKCQLIAAGAESIIEDPGGCRKGAHNPLIVWGKIHYSCLDDVKEEERTSGN